MVIGASLFQQGRCATCHGGPNWTISRVFYPPGEEFTGALPYTAQPLNPDGTVPQFDIGRLRTETYSVPPALQALNPASLPSGVATYRSWKPDGKTPFVYLYGTKEVDQYDSKGTHGNDQINCVLRAVGTFPSQPAPPATNTDGVVAPGAPPVLEVRAADMKALALGATGFNVPSLVGLATAGSYFHAGNARTLEEAFDTTFDAHLRAMQPGFLGDPATRKMSITSLVTFLLSIDDAQAPLSVATDLGFDPDLCAQMQVPPTSAAAAPTR
jgi:hypothetical protein